MLILKEYFNPNTNSCCLYSFNRTQKKIPATLFHTKKVNKGLALPYFNVRKIQTQSCHIQQGFPNLVQEGHCPPEFTLAPTCLNTPA